MSSDDSELTHYGILRKSGRYPWGSGNNEAQRSAMFTDYVKNLKDQGLTDPEIARGIGLASPSKDPDAFSVAMLRDTTSVAKEVRILQQSRDCVKLRDKGTSVREIAKRLDLSPGTVTARLKRSEDMKETALTSTANLLRDKVKTHKVVDIGAGTEVSLGISPEKLRAAVSILRDEGYKVYNLPTKILGTRHDTSRRILADKNLSFSDAAKLKDSVHILTEWTENDGVSYLNIREPLSLSSKRVQIKYAEDGGTKEDGFIYVRPGVKDLSMGANQYAQVRIVVDGTHYMKGVAIQKEGLPSGVDVVFNTNKPRSSDKLSALKELKDDPDNPFGSTIKKQFYEKDPKTGDEKVTSVMNIVNQPGDWDSWRNSFPSQVLSKQPHNFIRDRLNATREETTRSILEASQITNPVVKQIIMRKLADKIDSDAVELRAAAMPGQKTKVILPIPGLNKNEIYAPQDFATGDRVVLIRFPHGGRFEIPEVTVNNNHRGAKKLIGNAVDAIGIHPSVAERLSGADFDGDTVLVVPNPRGSIKGFNSLGSSAKFYEDSFKNFEPKRKYGGYEVIGKKPNGEDKGNFPLMKATGLEMGKITNLITDMQVKGAKPEHIVRAVKHSMVVIDAEKHQLDYKQSEIDNGIKQLKTLYQGGPKAGAGTLLSRATAGIDIPEQKLRKASLGGPIDPKTGAYVYVPTGKTHKKMNPVTKKYDSDELHPNMQNEKRLAVTPDARTLLSKSPSPVEVLYANHANSMKALANKTRLAADKIKTPPTNQKAKVVYKQEVDDLVAQIKTATGQKPLDRQANAIANATFRAKLKEDPTLYADKERKRKVQAQTKAAVRTRMGLKQPVIHLTDRQWDAIQSGAVSTNRLKKILEYAEPNRVKELAMPRANTVMTSSVSSRAKAMLNANVPPADIARALGISPSTLAAAMKRGDL
ncbi:winged helix-turn-helix transcriptional regulator [Candidatus Dependentiae bacterium]|nr:MAG: winged helix-turn-helix transcriptional regulator [Candidatus Dependentiae bacterium]